ncbi:hypothetical protein FXF53_25095 [Micromonospora sp. WP24]|uniref:site-specific integrase n=1 Tax=Micromonospora sp. WP24 TaxID=2604469 RepID=UPI0011D8E515|nr:site-specific integrase [Micromonospora sp. WP24]TYB95254.1 hypothetical protein FXF53_25095 [Micromonospora sp. WP24]
MNVEELRDAVIGPVLLPGDDGFADEVASFNLNDLSQPAVAVSVTDAADVQAAGGELEELLREWLVGYASPHTRAAYRRDLQHWLAFLVASGVDPLREARRVHTHAWLRAQEAAGGASAATRARRLAAVSAFYSWLIAEDRTDRATASPRTQPARSGSCSAHTASCSTTTASTCRR